MVNDLRIETGLICDVMLEQVTIDFVTVELFQSSEL